MSLARLWKEFDVDRDVTVFHAVPCAGVEAILSDGFTLQSLLRYPAKTLIFWQTPTARPGTAYFILPRQAILEAEANGAWRLTYRVDPGEGAYYALGGRRAGEPGADRLDARGALICLPDGCDGVAPGLAEDGEHAYYAFIAGSDDLLERTTEAVRAVAAYTRREDYLLLRSMLLGDNETFARGVPRLAECLPVEVKNMRGLPQLPGHYGLDPVEHTLAALMESAKSTTLMERFAGERTVCREWIRCVLVYHDIGKKMNPFNPAHARLSAKLARFHLRSMGYEEHEEQIIARLVETHDVLGGVKRGLLTALEGLRILCHGMGTLVPLDLLVDMHYEVARADIHSIGSLRHISLENEYLAMSRTLPELGWACQA